MFNKKKQQQISSKIKELGTEFTKLRRGDLITSSFKSQSRPKPITLQRFHSFQNSNNVNRIIQNRIKQIQKDNNDGYADDVEDNGDDEAIDRTNKISGYRSSKTEIKVDNSNKTPGVSEVKSISVVDTSTISVTRDKETIKPVEDKCAIVVKAVSKKIISNNKIQTLSTLKNSDINYQDQNLNNYLKEDNSINLAYVKLSKRKRQIDHNTISVYDNVEVKYLPNRSEIESDDSIIHNKLNNQMVTSTSTFSTNSSNQSSPELNNKDDKQESESLLPKIYLNNDEDEEHRFIDSKPDRRDSGVGSSLTRENK